MICAISISYGVVVYSRKRNVESRRYNFLKCAIAKMKDYVSDA